MNIRIDKMMEELPPQKTIPGVFASYTVADVMDEEGKTVRNLTLDVELALTRESGRRFVVPAVFLLTDRGTAVLRKALESWKGEKWTKAEQKAFDPEVDLIGKPLDAVVVHRAQANGKLVAKVKAFRPASDPKLQVSPEFLAEREAKAQELKVEVGQQGAVVATSGGGGNGAAPVAVAVPANARL